MTFRNIIFIFSAVFFSCTSAAAQEKKEAPKDYKPARDFFVFQLHYDGLAGATEGIALRGFNRGLSTHIMYDFPFKNSSFSFAAGIGFSTHNYYLKGQRFRMEGQPNVEFINLIEPDLQNYRSMKLSTNYAEAPLEFRYFSNKYNRNVGFKASLGMKVGYMLNAHTKEKVAMNGRTITQKFSNNNHLFNQWSFTPTVKLGWGNFAVFAQYNITQMFSPGAGPEVYPFSIGITLTGL